MKLKSRKLKVFALVGSSLVLFAMGFFVWSNHACQKAARGIVFRSVEDIPANDVGMVLGTGKLTRGGSANWHFIHRINAAAKLYHAGKVRHLLVSGDNHVAGYDEPTDMRDALVAKGVPSEAITCDYAGFRTLDSVVRAQSVFGLKKFTIITEEFHCPRALWIAKQHGLDVVALAAPDVDRAGWSARVKARELFARGWCAIDLYVLHRGPKFSGPREPILFSANSR